MTTVDDIIEAVLQREKQGEPPYLAKNDAGGRTSWGIAERFHPDAWKNGPPSKEDARRILTMEYAGPFLPLRAAGLSDDVLDCAVDDAVLSGVASAMKRLQWTLGVTPDGVLGPQTLAAVRQWNQRALLQRLVVERVTRLCRLVQARPSDLTNIVGWVVRALAFLPEEGTGR